MGSQADRQRGIVAWPRSSGAVTVLAVFFALSYLLVCLVRLFDWPDWVPTGCRSSGAYGSPYLDLPPAASIGRLASLAVLPPALAALVAQASPKTA